MKTSKILYISLILLISGCSDLVVYENEINLNIEDYDAAYNITKRYYPFFEFKRINWDSLYYKYRPEAEKAEGDEIYPILCKLFKELKDGHVSVFTEGGFQVPIYEWPRNKDKDSFDQLVVKRYFDEELNLAGDGNFAYGILNTNLGYVHISTFKEGDWVKDFDNIIKFLENTRGLIIDVRNNPGGVITSINFITSRLIKNPIEYIGYNYDNTQKKSIILPYRHYKYTKPMAVLINGASFSAAEIFAEIMGQIPNAALIGDTTGGGGGGKNIDYFNLPSGKKINFPTIYFKRYDGEMVEWNGVLPDILVEQTKHDKENGKDYQIEAAINFLTEQSGM